MNVREALDNIYKEFEKTYEEAKKEGREQGLEEAWECARSVVDCKVPFDFWELASGQSMLAVFRQYSAKEAIAKIKEYEEKQKHDCEHCSKTYGTLGCCDMVNNEWVYSCKEGHKEYEEKNIKFGDILESHINGYKYIALRVDEDGYVNCIDQYGRASTQHKGGFKVIEHNPQIESVFEKIREADE